MDGTWGKAAAAPTAAAASSNTRGKDKGGCSGCGCQNQTLLSTTYSHTTIVASNQYNFIIASEYNFKAG